MTIETGEPTPNTPILAKRRRPARIVLAIVAAVLVGAGSWAYRYNPLAQNWNQSSGEWGSYVGTLGGVEAHYSYLSNNTPLSTQVWDEPTGTLIKSRQVV